MAKKRKWIQKAVKEEGSFTKWCKAHGFNSVNQACIKEAKRIASKNNDKELMGKANFAARAQKGF